MEKVVRVGHWNGMRRSVADLQRGIAHSALPIRRMVSEARCPRPKAVSVEPELQQPNEQIP